MATAKLTTQQLEIVGQFGDHSFDYPQLGFDAVAKKMGVKFPATPAGKLFRRECKTIFDRERGK